jgi:hypothetical protein
MSNAPGPDDCICAEAELTHRSYLDYTMSKRWRSVGVWEGGEEIRYATKETNDSGLHAPFASVPHAPCQPRGRPSGQ